MIMIRCWRCGGFGSLHGEGVCEFTRVPWSDWIQFEPLKTTKPLSPQLLDVQPTEGEDQRVAEGLPEEGEGD